MNGGLSEAWRTITAEAAAAIVRVAAAPSGRTSGQQGRAMRPLRASELVDAVPVGVGKRTQATLAALDARDQLLVEAARRHCIGMSERQAATMLRSALLRYASGRWRRSRFAIECPEPLERLDALLWQVLRVRDHAPSESLIRQVLARR